MNNFNVSDKNQYNNIQFLGYSVPTDFISKKVQITPQVIGTKQEYRGLDNDFADWIGRIQTMKEAIEKTSSLSSVNKSEHCLKVFMVPEFFFRGKKGAYDFETATLISESLREIVNSPKYKDYLFVFGTTVTYSHDENNKYYPYKPYNFSFIQKGNGTEKDSCIVMKKFTSTIDYVNTKGNDIITNSNIDLPTKKELEIHSGEEKIFSYDPKGIVAFDNIRIGVEPCRDNLKRRLEDDTKASKVDILLVPSCGVLKKDLVISKKLSNKGYVFSVDGLGESYARVVTSDGREIQAKESSGFSPSDAFSANQIFSGKGTIHVFPTMEVNRSKEVKMSLHTHRASSMTLG